MLKRTRLRKRSRPRLKSLKWYHDKLWKLFSIFIRQRDQGKCFTCGVIKPWKQMQAGHFKHRKLDYDERNINCQCPRCNKFLHGNLDIYAEKLEEKYGHGILQRLREDASIVHKYTRSELEDLIKQYETNFPPTERKRKS